MTASCPQTTAAIPTVFVAGGAGGGAVTSAQLETTIVIGTATTPIADQRTIPAECVVRTKLEPAACTGSAIAARREMAYRDPRDMGNGGLMVTAARSTMRKQRMQPAIPDLPVLER